MIPQQHSTRTPEDRAQSFSVSASYMARVTLVGITNGWDLPLRSPSHRLWAKNLLTSLAAAAAAAAALSWLYRQSEQQQQWPCWGVSVLSVLRHSVCFITDKWRRQLRPDYGTYYRVLVCYDDPQIHGILLLNFCRQHLLKDCNSRTITWLTLEHSANDFNSKLIFSTIFK